MFAKPIEAVLFDMDGLLIDTEAVYIEAYQAAARVLDLEMPLSFCHSMIGIPSPVCERMIRDFHGPGFSFEAFERHFDDYAEDRFAAGVPVKPGGVELLDFLESRGLPRALATSSSLPTVKKHLCGVGLYDRFAAIVTRNDVSQGKPAPDIYLEAARRLGVPPAHCIALEDSATGLTAAHAAGTMVIMVPDIVPPTDEVRAKCLHIAPDLHAVRRLLGEAITRR
jgi:HAD superfamily hydrolase (TIGR01509 family)